MNKVLIDEPALFAIGFYDIGCYPYTG